MEVDPDTLYFEVVTQAGRIVDRGAIPYLKLQSK
jgi:hypothetical protein